MKTDVILLPGLHGSTALYDALIAPPSPGLVKWIV